VGPERLARWIDGFADRHGPFSAAAADGWLVLTAADGAVAELAAPPGAGGAVAGGAVAGGAVAGGAVAEFVAKFVASASARRRLGLLLVRRGGIAVGVAVGAELAASKVDSAYVQSRTAAGGWSQQRFARRRENQAKALAGGAADVAARLLVGDPLDALVTGGDRGLVDAVLADARLVGLPAPARHLDVPDPRLAVLKAAVTATRAVRITVRDPHP
jgi:hypothetical protein